MVIRRTDTNSHSLNRNRYIDGTTGETAEEEPEKGEKALITQAFYTP